MIDILAVDTTPAPPKVIFFDVYETLLDMSDVEKKVNHVLDSRRGYTIWFEMMMQYCFVDNSIEQFHSFLSIATATMQMAAKTLGKTIEDRHIQTIMEVLRHLPVHEDVQKGLAALDKNNFVIAALTNSPREIVMDRMERTGLISYFEMVLSAEQFKKYKPSPLVYDWACKKLSVSPSEALMVSAHGWDIAGAAGAGMRTAYMMQKKQMLYPLAPHPDFTCETIVDLANQLRNAM